MDAVDVLCAQLTRDLFAIAKFLSRHNMTRDLRNGALCNSMWQFLMRIIKVELNHSEYAVCRIVSVRAVVAMHAISQLQPRRWYNITKLSVERRSMTALYRIWTTAICWTCGGGAVYRLWVTVHREVSATQRSREIVDWTVDSCVLPVLISRTPRVTRSGVGTLSVDDLERVPEVLWTWRDTLTVFL